MIKTNKKIPKNIILSLENVSISYGTFEAVRNVFCNFKKGDITSLIGPSGCGKSTLLNLIAGLQAPTSGKIVIDGQAIKGPGPDRGVIFQNYALMPWLTTIQNIEFALNTVFPAKTKADVKERARKYLRMVGLEKASNKFPKELSGGMKQRVAIARALSINPNMLLMDNLSFFIQYNKLF